MGDVNESLTLLDKLLKEKGIDKKKQALQYLAQIAEHLTEACVDIPEMKSIIQSTAQQIGSTQLSVSATTALIQLTAVGGRFREYIARDVDIHGNIVSLLRNRTLSGSHDLAFALAVNTTLIPQEAQSFHRAFTGVKLPPGANRKPSPPYSTSFTGMVRHWLFNPSQFMYEGTLIAQLCCLAKGAQDALDVIMPLTSLIQKRLQKPDSAAQVSAVLKNTLLALSASPEQMDSAFKQFTASTPGSLSLLDVVVQALVPKGASFRPEEIDLIPKHVAAMASESNHIAQMPPTGTRLVECLTLLTSRRSQRECLRARGVYPVIREWDSWVRKSIEKDVDEETEEAVQNLVNALASIEVSSEEEGDKVRSELVAKAMASQEAQDTPQPEIQGGSTEAARLPRPVDDPLLQELDQAKQ